MGLAFTVQTFDQYLKNPVDTTSPPNADSFSILEQLLVQQTVHYEKERLPRTPEELAIIERSLDLSKKRHPDSSKTVYEDMVRYSMTAGDINKAQTYADLSSKFMHENYLGWKWYADSFTALALSGIKTYQYKDTFQEALKGYEKMIPIAEPIGYFFLGDFYEKFAMFDKAKEAYEHAVSSTAASTGTHEGKRELNVARKLAQERLNFIDTILPFVPISKSLPNLLQ